MSLLRCDLVPPAPLFIRHLPKKIAAEITTPAKPIAQINTLYFVFWASILDSSRSTIFAASMLVISFKISTN